MFTHMIDWNLKADIKPEFFKKWRAEALPLFKKAPGFFDIVVLNDVVQPNHLFILCFWEEKKNAEYWEKEWFPKVKMIFEPLWMNPPVLKYYNVEETFSEKFFNKVMV